MKKILNVLLFISIINLFGFCLANTHVNALSTAEQKLSLEKIFIINI